ncbi:MAG: NAD(P)-dependent oxidoreductase [Rhodobacteraceae bacterium]|nr:NAD(P)-dependent oxidoreductase [Paracoccaceae bacterium]
MSRHPMLSFVDIANAMPSKREASQRLGDFSEIYDDYPPDLASQQASRCSQCGVPYCQTHCPLHNNIPDWLKLTAEQRYREAYDLSQQTNSFPEICGRICPQDRLCEGNCVIEQSGHGTVTIGSVERYLTDMAWREGWVEPIRPVRQHDFSVGIVGSGPAGLAAADRLRRSGLHVVVYDRHDRAGGLLTYGIPGFKLEKRIVMRRVEQLSDGGTEFRLNVEVGRDVAFAELQRRHDALLIATGAYKSRDLACPGIGSNGIVAAIDYLTASNRKSFGDEVPEFDGGRLNASGKKVVVIGGGDTAMDCVRTAVRQEARSVTCLYRRDRENMPGSRREVHNAEEEGVEFDWLTVPLAFVGSRTVRGIHVQRMRLSDRDATGRRAPEPIAGSTVIRDADLVIKALGFEPEDLPGTWEARELEVTGWGTVRSRFGTHETSIPGVYAAGDIVRGASLVVWAIRDGQEAADSILGQFRRTTSAAEN